MLVKIVGTIVITSKGNVAGVVHMDTVVKKVGHLEMDVMGHLVASIYMLVLIRQLVS